MEVGVGMEAEAEAVGTTIAPGTQTTSLCHHEAVTKIAIATETVTAAGEVGIADTRGRTRAVGMTSRALGRGTDDAAPDQAAKYGKIIPANTSLSTR